MSTKKDFKFELGEGLDELPERKYQKGSQYDAVLEGFEAQPKKYVPVTIKDKDANYIRLQLHKRIATLELKGVGVTVANGVCYLMKEAAITVKPKK